MRIPGAKTGKRFARWVSARIFGGALILGYHRVANPGDDVYDICVTPSHFAGHLEILRKYAQPISLPELIKYLDNGALPARSVCLTFDDGYADTLYNAKPLLDKYEIPASVFVCTGYPGREFWWDELERLVVSSRADLLTLYSKLDQNQFKWDQEIRGHGMEAGRKGSVRGAFLNALYRWLLTLAPKTRETVVDIVRVWAESESEGSSIRRALTSSELLSLAEKNLIEIGAHTRLHPALPRLTVEEQTDEIVSSKQYLQDLLGRPVWSFAYPNGEMNLETREILVRTGFRSACCSEMNVIRPGHDHYNLPRFWPGDEDGDRFMQRLKWWI